MNEEQVERFLENLERIAVANDPESLFKDVDLGAYAKSVLVD